MAAELGITKISSDEYHVADLEKFIAWAETLNPEVPSVIYGVEDGIL